MGAPDSPGRREVRARPLSSPTRVARVLPDVSGLDKTFDYLAPADVDVDVGTRVRVDLHGRRIGGWVVDVLDAPQALARPLKPIAKVTGLGPPAHVVDLARWASWRWAGRLAAFLGTASPATAVRRLPPPGRRAERSPSPASSPAPTSEHEVFAHGRAIVRVPPAGDVTPLARAAARRGDALVLAPTHAYARRVARALREAGVPVAVFPDDWAQAAAGGCAVVGARAAAWAPMPRVDAVVVLDEHDEAYQEERAPTWHARDVALERAHRDGAPCALVSPCPSLDALALDGCALVTPSRADERAGWPVVEVVDRRDEPPGLGLYSERLVRALREAARVVCVLNRKGRARLLACAACGAIATCEGCGAAVEQADEGLRCRRCGAVRPTICLACGATRLKALRVGVTRVREELEHLARRPVAEVTGDARAPTPGDLDAPVVVGTEAVLHRVRRADVVAFLDFDQELLAPRYRAAEEAMALLVRAARLVGGRDQGGGGRLLVQTRLPGHETIDAAVHADPSRLALVESARRAALRFPPEAALAMLSGDGADDFARALEARLGIEVLGPSDGRWLVRAADHHTLCDALAQVERPAARVRVAVDPLRA